MSQSSDYDNQFSSSYDYVNQVSYENASFGSDVPRFNILELLIMVLSVIAVIGVFSWGVFSQNTLNRDQQKAFEVSEIISALDMFYMNSSSIPSRRAYPQATCSELLNEVDFENALRLALTGKRPDLDSHTYILPEKFPRDKSGVYSTTIGERRVTYRCPDKLATQSSNQQVYNDGYPSCNFNRRQRLNNCYLYTSSTNGDTFRIGYYNQSQGNFIVYKKYRNGPLTQESI